ncbi:ATP-binding cassette sub-family B member 10, mitochondrial [Nephila pilipes]|uniref:ATP-binding cassette sub-family B member 10, mitochondrial n=1 Tax=Nephila pilipes TaxID=299642 RepID=A0A8X6QXQ8_NEPPI|nr:ATP-binding cassette sub-family B member 10, mitochondrial [Nephila pilipes]
MWFQLYHSRLIGNSLLNIYRKNALSNHSLIFQNFSKKPSYKRKPYFSYLFTGTPNKHFTRFVSNVPKKPVHKELKRLIKVAQSQKWKLTGAVLFLFVSSTVTMAVPFCVGKLIDMMTSSSEDLQKNLVLFCKILVVIFFIGGLANFGRVYLMNISSHQVTNTLRRKVYGSILCQEAAFFDHTKTGELINRISADTTTVGMSITNNISDGLRYSFIFTAASCLMIYTSPTLAAVGLITVAPVAIVAAVAGNILKRNSKAVQDALADSTQVSEERISNIRTVQAFAKLVEENQIYSNKINNVLHFAYKESLGRAIFFGMTGFSGNLIILSVLYNGGSMMSTNQITIGGLSSFLLYAAYVGISIGGLSSFYSELMRGLGASTRLWELIDKKPLISYEGGITLPNFDGNINFENVSFAYPSRPDSMILSDFNLTIPSGSVYALVGASGCGKSTIGSLVLRLYDSQKGVISINNHDIKLLNLKWLRSNIGIVSQEPVLFSFSVRENILYGTDTPEKVSDEILEDVLLKANALEFVQQFPKGLDTLVGERGVMLSGGQRQRIAIARALLKNPKILILDEATSALDADSEYLVHKALEQLMRGRTVITIAHRLSTVKNADTIVVLENGKVIEKGKYDDLLLNKGPFYRLVQLQSLKTK